VGAVGFSTNPHKYFAIVVQMQWLPPLSGHTPPFQDAVQALTLLQSGKITGMPIFPNKKITHSKNEAIEDIDAVVTLCKNMQIVVVGDETLL